MTDSPALPLLIQHVCLGSTIQSLSNPDFKTVLTPVFSCLTKIFTNLKIKIYYSIWIALSFEVYFMQYKTQLYKISTLKLEKLDWDFVVLFPNIFQKQLLVILILSVSWRPTHHKVQIALNYSVSIKNWNVKILARKKTAEIYLNPAIITCILKLQITSRLPINERNHLVRN